MSKTRDEIEQSSATLNAKAFLVHYVYLILAAGREDFRSIA